MHDLVIIPCGAKKHQSKTVAAKMYQGPYFKACLRYAQSIIRRDSILILSAKYGFLRLNQEIEPYELTLGDPGCVTAADLRKQCDALSLSERNDVALGGKRYTSMCRAVWPNVLTPVPSVGIGKQMQWMKHHLGRLT